jgi:hypothetical protein
MGGAGKWIKKNPLAAAALLGVASGGIGLLAAPAAGAGAAAAGAAGAATAGGAAPLGLGTAALFGATPGAAAGLLAPTTTAATLLAPAAVGTMGSSILAPAVAAEGLGGGFAALAGGASPLAAEGAASMAPMSAWDKFGAFADKVGPYAKMAGQAQGLLSPQEQPQAPQIAPPQLRGPGQGLSPSPQYGGGSGLYGVDPEEEKRRAYMMWAQQNGVA